MMSVAVPLTLWTVLCDVCGCSSDVVMGIRSTSRYFLSWSRHQIVARWPDLGGQCATGVAL